MKLRWLFILLCCSSCLLAQTALYKIEGDKKKIEIPFEFKNNFIIVNILFNRILPLRFIVDTGAEYTILTKKEFSDILGVTYDRQFDILGADLKTYLIAYLAKEVDIKLGRLTARDQNILVLDEDYPKFEEFAGSQIDGILGGDLFKNFVVEINFKKGKLILYEPISYHGPEKDYSTIPIIKIANKPYLFARSEVKKDSVVSLKMLIDTGAGFPLLLHTNTHDQLQLPDNVFAGNIGVGLGGYIKGYMGRTHSFELSPFEFRNVITHFQDVNLLQDTSLLNGRNGIIGNEILSRFNIIIDYFRNKMHLKPNKKFRKKFKFDRSGALIIASGKSLNHYIVYDIIKNSPAHLAGLQIGDQILSINGWPANTLKLSSLIRRLQGKVGKKIRLKIYRNGEKLKVKFRLKDIL